MILSIDPSIGNCGWALLAEGEPPERVDSGTWHPSAAKGAADRYDQLALFVRGKLHDLHGANRQDTVVIEVPSGGQRHSATQLMAYARAIGVCEAAGVLCGCKVVRVPVLAWKGNARKASTDLIVRASLGYTPRDDNESDAIGIGIWWLRSRASGYRREVEAALRRA